MQLLNALCMRGSVVSGFRSCIWSLAGSFHLHDQDLGAWKKGHDRVTCFNIEAVVFCYPLTTNKT